MNKLKPGISGQEVRHKPGEDRPPRGEAGAEFTQDQARLRNPKWGLTMGDLFDTFR